MVSEAVIWSIFLLPLGSFVFAALVVRPFFNRFSLISGLVTIAALGTALGFSIWTLRSVILGHHLEFEPLEWLEVGDATIEIPANNRMDDTPTSIDWGTHGILACIDAEGDSMTCGAATLTLEGSAIGALLRADAISRAPLVLEVGHATAERLGLSFRF